MLRINAIPNAPAAKSYFAQSDYYIDGQEQEAQWHGNGAELLGLRGKIDQNVFEVLCDNINPTNGKQLTAKHIENRRVGYDFTFSLPKSISILHALGQDDRIPGEFRAAVADTMAEMEREFATRVRKKGKDEDRTTGNMIWTDFLHHTSRPINGTPDPQLHIHAVVFNATFDKEENQWKAGQFGDLKANAPYFQAVFRARLANRMKALGYDIKVKKDDFEIVGVPERTLKEFSRRTSLIEKTADLLDIKRPESKAKLGATTREAKKEGQTWGSLVSDWENRLQPGELQAIHSTVLKSLRQPVALAYDNREALDWSLRHLLERKSVVPQRELLTTALRYGIGHVTLDGLHDELGKRKDLIRRDLGGQALVSTQGVLNEEKQIVAFAVKGRGRFRPLQPSARSSQGAGLTAKVAEADKHDTATTPPFGQEASGFTRLYRVEPAKKAVHPDWVVEMQRERGHLEAQDRWFVQKPEMLDWYREDTNGPSVTTFVDVPSSDLERYRVCNIKETIAGRTPESFSKDPQNEFFLPRQLADTRKQIHHDQVRSTTKATLSPSQQAAIKHAWYSRDRLILIRGAAGTGKTTMTKALLDGVDVPWVILAPSAEASRGVLRKEGFTKADTLQKFLMDQELQDAVKNGLVILDEASLAGAHDMARLIQTADSLNARILLLGDRRQHKSVSRGDVLALLEDRAGLPVATVNEVQRQKHDGYKQAAELMGKGDVVGGFSKLNELGWIKDKGLVDDYISTMKSGVGAMIVAPTHAEGDFLTSQIRDRLKAERLLATSETELPTLRNLNYTKAELEQAKKDKPEGIILTRYGAYQPETKKLSVGDKIRITANGQTLDKKHRLNNGATYTVEGFTKGHIKLNNGWIIDKDFKHWTHGYVHTTFASQGKGEQQVFVSMPTQTLPAVNAAAGYVAATRGKQRVTIYTDNRAELLEAVQRSDTRLLASELVRAPRKGIKEKLRRRVHFLRDLGSRLLDNARGRGTQRVQTFERD